MFEQQQAVIDKTRNELLVVAHQVKAEFLSNIPDLVQERVKLKIANNPYVFQHLADPAISALKNRITYATSEVIKFIDSTVDDYILCEVHDLLQEFQSVGRRADGLIAPILEEVGFKLKMKERGLEREEHVIDFSSFYDAENATQLRDLMKHYNEKKMNYRSAVAQLEALKSDTLAKEALERWERVQSA